MNDTVNEIVEDIINPTEDAVENPATDAPKQEAQQPPQQTQSVLDDVETAVLLVVNKHGNVLPVVNIESLQMRRIATPREVYRICLDAADQLSSVSLLGEMTNIFTTLQKESSKFTAQQMANLLLQATQAKASEDA
jgi:hypothetical protein